jgi:chromosome segregation ATPase
LKLNKLNHSLSKEICNKTEEINVNHLSLSHLNYIFYFKFTVLKNYKKKYEEKLYENNQLKTELNKVNLELERFESHFAMQVDDYEVEIENLTNKLKEKDHTIKNLIDAAQEKDSLVVKLKTKLIEMNGGSESILDDTQNNSFDMAPESRESLKQRKIEGLLRLVQEKNQQIDELRNELNDLKNKSQMSDENELNLLRNGQHITSTPKNLKQVVESLEEELNLYRKLNSNRYNNLIGIFITNQIY